jgi:hypothetical protein
MHILEEMATFILRVDGILKMEAANSSATLGFGYQNKYCHTPKDSNVIINLSCKTFCFCGRMHCHKHSKAGRSQNGWLTVLEEYVLFLPLDIMAFYFRRSYCAPPPPTHTHRMNFLNKLCEVSVSEIRIVLKCDYSVHHY